MAMKYKNLVDIHKDLGIMPQNYELTKREQEVLNLIMQGLPKQQIADRLCISITTVKTHCVNIYQKFDYHSIPELIAKEWKKKYELEIKKFKKGVNNG